MRFYYIFTQEIHSVGGMQLYTAGKAKYLEEKGWTTIVAHPDFSKANCAYSSLKKYDVFANPIIELPPTAYSERIVSKTVSELAAYVNLEESDEIYIESHYDIAALWAELLAKKLHAKHINFNCNEIFRGGHKIYEYAQDFFWFKYIRKELYGLRPDTICKIFQGSRDIEPDESILFDAVEPNPIQEVSDQRLSRIGEADYTILYLGRAAKGYVTNIIDGVADFSKLYHERKVQFIIVGDATERTQEIENKTGGIDNLTVIQMGDMVPIPRKLYDYVDVVIAGAVCAEASARCGVPTIVADCESFWACGVLGYTIQNSMYCEDKQFESDFCTALCDVLIERGYEKYEYRFPDAIPEDEIYSDHLLYFNGCDTHPEYYDIKTINIPFNYGRVKYLQYVKYFLMKRYYKNGK